MHKLIISSEKKKRVLSSEFILFDLTEKVCRK